MNSREDSLVTPTGVETVLWNFGTGMDGFFPLANLIQGTDGNFYGTTSLGGTNARGTVYKITPSGTETVLWNFDFVTGTEPMGSLTQGVDGNFYGTVSGGGSIGGGTIFKVTPDGAETVLWDFGFGGNGGFTTISALVQGPDGNFYGTTNGQGTAGGGTLFKLIP